MHDTHASAEWRKQRNKNTMAPVKCGRQWLRLGTVKDSFSPRNGVYLVPHHVALCAVLFIFFPFVLTSTSPLDCVSFIPFSGGTLLFYVLPLSTPPCPLLYSFFLFYYLYKFITTILFLIHVIFFYQFFIYI